MTVLERVAYLRGLYEGLEIDTGKRKASCLQACLKQWKNLRRV